MWQHIKSILLILNCIFINSCACAVQRNAQYHFVVAKDGSGNFTTIQAAVNAVPDLRKNTTTIYIKNGIYKEKLLIGPTKTNIAFIGENIDKTIITYDDYAAKKNIFSEEIGTSGSASVFIYGEGFSAQNISFQNSAGPVGQAVAVRVSADKITFSNCRFLGCQDTLYTQGAGGASRQYYYHCYIEGTTDFIFGFSTAVFEACTIYGKKGGQYITAASTPDSSAYGYVFINCKIKGDKGASYYLGRPWRPNAKTVFINSEMSEIILPAGWHNWDKKEAEAATFYAEYNSTGAGAATYKRVPWSHQLTTEELNKYTLTKIFNGWLPLHH